MAERDSSDSSCVDEPWITWLCNLKSNKILAEVDKAFIEDAFNLYGLKLYFPQLYNKAINVLLDRYDDTPYSEEVTQAAVELYGLIHARYIVTIGGLDVMRQKYKKKDFGECPRMFCKGQAVLPVGASDEPLQMRLKMFCPRCREVYCCNETYKDFDGAVFGTTFAHIFFMTYEDLVPPATDRSSERYVPRVFGFRIHSSSGSLPRIANTVSSSQSSSSSTNGHPPLTTMIIGNDFNNEDAQLFPDSHPSAAAVAAKRKLASFNNSERPHIVGANSTGESYSSSAINGVVPTPTTAAAAVPPLVVLPGTSHITSPTTAGVVTRTGTSGRGAVVVPVEGGSAGKKSRIG